MDAVLARHLAKTQEMLAAAQALIDAGRMKIAEGEQQMRDGESAVDVAQTRLAALEDLVAELRREVEAGAAVGDRPAQRALALTASAAREIAAASQTNNGASQTNGGRTMGPTLDDIMSDGEERTVDQVVAIMRSRGYGWSRASVVNRCAERAKSGVLVRFVRDGRVSYKLAASSGDTLPSEPASSEGGRGPQPESDSQQGAGEVQGAGSLAI